MRALPLVAISIVGWSLSATPWSLFAAEAKSFGPDPRLHQTTVDRAIQYLAAQQSQDGALRQSLCPVGEFVQRAGRVQATDQRAHRGAGDADHLVAALPQLVDHPDVRVSAGAAAAERQCDPGSGR